MVECIPREAVLNVLFRQSCVSCDETKQVLNAVIEEIKSVPTADVISVVHCGECVFHEVADYGEGHTKNVCRLLSRQIQNDDFCSYGLRMDSE